MPVSAPYQEYILERLSGLGRVSAKRMFGGVGLYLDGVFFALIADDTLYFKVDHATKALYEAAGMGPFRPSPHRPMTMGYYEVPVDVLEDDDRVAMWARTAWDVAKRRSSTPSRRKGTA